MQSRMWQERHIDAIATVRGNARWSGQVRRKTELTGSVSPKPAKMLSYAKRESS